MATIEKGIPLQFGPGINRDSTKFAMNVCVDGQWCRFYLGRPKKIGGYQSLYSLLPDIQRGADVVSENGINYFHSGSATQLYSIPITDAGQNFGLIVRTPVDLVPSVNNTWQFDSMFDIDSSKKIIFAHAGQNLASISSTVNTPVFYGDPTSAAPFVDVGESVSGGVCCLHPYPVLYGNDGFILWPAPGTINFASPGNSGSLRITGSKIVKGVSVRGGSGFSPAGLFWSLDELHRIYFIGAPSTFANDKVGNTYLLSSSSVVEYNGILYWPCADKRFSLWNGGIQDVANSFNQRFFFENLNYAQRQKVWGMAVPTFNEIVWFAPLFGATECNWMIVYNLTDKSWYDSPINRSCGVAAKVYPYPIMFDNQASPTGKYRMWQHETGTDAVDGTVVNAIASYFETAILTLVDKDKDCWTQMDWFEPDFVMTGSLQFQLTGETTPQAPTNLSPTVYDIFPHTTKIEPKDQRRYLRARISSNIEGGNYFMGKPMMKLSEGNERTFKTS